MSCYSVEANHVGLSRRRLGFESPWQHFYAIFKFFLMVILSGCLLSCDIQTAVNSRGFHFLHDTHIISYHMLSNKYLKLQSAVKIY